MATKNNRAGRAVQFMPFDAMKGLQEALREKERIVVEPKILSEEQKDELDRIIHEIQPNDMVKVIYYDKGEYVSLMGMISRIRLDQQFLSIVKTTIPLQDIVEIEICRKNDEKKD